MYMCAGNMLCNYLIKIAIGLRQNLLLIYDSHSIIRSTQSGHNYCVQSALEAATLFVLFTYGVEGSSRSCPDVSYSVTFSNDEPELTL